MFLQSCLFQLQLRVDLCHVQLYPRTLTLTSVLTRSRGTLVLCFSANMHQKINIT